MLIRKPINPTQHEYNELCRKGGGIKSGPARSRVLALLQASGAKINEGAHAELKSHLDAVGPGNPWYVFYALGLSWGHIAKHSEEFTAAAAAYLDHGAPSDLARAQEFYTERGREPIKNSLESGRILLQAATFIPVGVPSEIGQLADIQRKWNPLCFGPRKIPWIGKWNGTSMFLVALLSSPALWKMLKDGTVLLPSGGPISTGLELMHAAHLISARPDRLEPENNQDKLGSLSLDNGLMWELHKGLPSSNMVDIHSGLYELGTRSTALT